MEDQRHFLVYVTDILVHDGRPVILGLTPCGEKRVCIRIRWFRFPWYMSPRGMKLSSKAQASEWIDNVLRPWIRSHAERLREKDDIPLYIKRAAGPNVTYTPIAVKKRSLCGGLNEESYYAMMEDVDSRIVSFLGKTVEKGVESFNHDEDPVLTFQHVTGIRSFQYVRFAESNYETTKVFRKSVCDIEVDVKVGDIQVQGKHFDPPVAAPKMVVASFDLETDGLHADRGHEIRMISVSLWEYPWRYREDVLLIRHRMNLEDLTRYRVIDCGDDEAKLIGAFADFVSSNRATFCTGWNIMGFDLRFLWKRAEALNCTHLLQPLSWMSTPLRGNEKDLSSSAFGHNKIFQINTHGLHILDGLVMARKSQAQLKMTTFKLEAFAKWIGQEKYDVSYQKMVEAFETRDEDLLREVADYCVQDSRLVPPILARMEEPDKCMAMATLAAVPLSYVLNRGQQILTWSMITEGATRMNCVINKFKYPTEVEDGYTGATVIEPKQGYYTDPVLVMDFKSLYPSCMLGYNVCLSSLVEITDRPYAAVEEQYASPTNDTPTYKQFTVVDLGAKRIVFDNSEWMKKNAVIPQALTRLLDERAAVKKSMKKMDPEGVQYAKANARQNALKVACNSIYGFLGAKTSPVYAIPLAAAVTKLGRLGLDRTCAKIRELCDSGHIQADASVVYGDTDSVMVRLPGCPLVDAEKTARLLATEATNAFPPPMELEFEMILLPYLLLSKKRYAGKSWETATVPGKQVIKGIATQRRDYSSIVKEGIQGVIDALLESTDGKGAQRALESTRSTLRLISSKQVPFEKLVVTKELSRQVVQKIKALPVPESKQKDMSSILRAAADAKKEAARKNEEQASKGYKTDPPHAIVSKRMRERDPDHAPKVGEQVSFVILRGTSKNVSVSDRAEDAEYARRHNLHIDYGYYAEQAGSQMLDLLHKAGLGDEGRKIVDEEVKRAVNATTGQASILSFFGAKRGPIEAGLGSSN